MTERKAVNPWTWQDQYGFSQAIDVRGGGRVVYCAGQTSVDDQGNVRHAGDMAAQIEQALDNLDVVLRHAGLSLAHIVRMNYYTTNVQAFFGAAETLGKRLQAAGIQPAGTLLGVAALFHPDAMIEIEATAVE